MLHWVISSDKCALTIMEEFITGRKTEETFIGKIVRPVYNITNKQITILSIVLLIIAISKYICLFGLTI